jgi:hypothetical protein
LKAISFDDFGEERICPKGVSNITGSTPRTKTELSGNHYALRENTGSIREQSYQAFYQWL